MRSPGRPAGEFERKKRIVLSVIEEQGDRCTLSNKRIAEITGFTVPMVASYIMSLKRDGIVTSEVTKVYLGSDKWAVSRVVRMNNPRPPPEFAPRTTCSESTRWTKPSDHWGR